MGTPASCRPRSPAGARLRRLALVAALATSACGGDDALRLTLPDLEGRPRGLFEGDPARAVVVLFAREDCPISNRYAPEVARLHERFLPHGVRFWLVYPDPRSTADGIRAHLRQHRYSFGALRDPEHRLVTLTGAEVTPEAAVFDDTGRLVYRGRIDDLYLDFGEWRAAPTSRDLENALEAVLAGRDPEPARTEAIGCYIADLR